MSKIFFIEEAKTLKTNLKTKCYIKYYFPNNFIQNHFIDLIKLRLTDGIISRNVIYKNIYFNDIILKIHNTQNTNFFNPNSIVSKFLIFDIYYKDSDTNISIKNLLISYLDNNKEFDNTFKNIFLIENIIVPNNTIYISMLIKTKKIIKEINLENDYHISELFNI